MDGTVSRRFGRRVEKERRLLLLHVMGVLGRRTAAEVEERSRRRPSLSLSPVCRLSLLFIMGSFVRSIVNENDVGIEGTHWPDCES